MHGGAKSSGATRLHRRTGRVASNCRAVDAMDSDANDFVETDADILTFDVPDDALERAANAEQKAFTMLYCTSPWYNCGLPQ
jgi:hypothetical protein